MRINVDLDLCQGYGQCVFEAPDLFNLLEDGSLEFVAETSEERRQAAEAASDACPVQAIFLTED